MTGALWAGACTGLALILAGGRDSERRLRRAVPQARSPGGLGQQAGPVIRGISRSAQVRAASGCAGIGAMAVLSDLLGGPWRNPVAMLLGAITGLVVGRVVIRLEPAATRRSRAAIRADLPVTADMLAAAVEAGLSVHAAAEAVGRAMSGPMGLALNSVVAECALGAEPGTCWRRIGEGDPDGRWPGDESLDHFGRSVARALDSGGPLAMTLQGLAEDVRARRKADALVVAHKASVRALAPLALCFLPGFLLLGVVPVVLGLAGAALKSLG